MNNRNIENDHLTNRRHAHRWFGLIALIIAGEMIFALPFHIPRFFRPTFLDVFQLSNAELGDIFAVYGVVAMLAYFPGGAVADRFSARNLMCLSLIATATGGLYLAMIPTPWGLMLLFGYWGCTSILLFWAALIKATRGWGGDMAQGRAFGILDGGRGLVAAGAASLAVLILGAAFDGVEGGYSATESRLALKWVIYCYTCATCVAAGLLWWALPSESGTVARETKYPLSGIRQVLREPKVWLQALVVICAYCGYKGLDNYGLYAVALLKMDEIEAASFTAQIAYLRPLAAIAAGILADRFNAGRILVLSFMALAVVYLFLAGVSVNEQRLVLIYLNILMSAVAVFSIRGIYFALLEESKIEWKHTGTAVGLISLLGFTPDVFFAAVTGRILDTDPALTGFQYYFVFLSLVASIGCIASWLLAVRIQPLIRND